MSPIADWYRPKWHWLKLRLCLHSRSVLWFRYYPTSHCLCRSKIMKAIWRNCLYPEAGKKWIDWGQTLPGILIRICWKYQIRMSASGVFVCSSKIGFLRNECTRSVLSASLVQSLLETNPRILTRLTSSNKCCNIHWTGNFIKSSQLCSYNYSWKITYSLKNWTKLLNSINICGLLTREKVLDLLW